MPTDWISSFPELSRLDASERTLLGASAQLVSLPAGTTVFAPGNPATSFLLLLDGTVRVQQVSSSGREIVLYRVAGGESCIMTTACLLSQETYNAEGIVESPQVRAVTVPRSAFEELMARSAGFRRFVFSNYCSRITDLLHVVEEVAFERIDKRLAQKLLERADAQGRLRVTHQDLAIELGSAREVISRHLKEFQRRGWLELSRGLIALTAREALEGLASSP